MEDEPHEIWYYSRDGEKRGPVSFTHLQAKAKDASLNPRLDKIWTKGMDEWKPASEIEGLFKRRPAPEVEVQEAPAPVVKIEHYPLPFEETVEEQMARQTDWPGARRRSFLIMTLVFPFIWFFVLAAGFEFLTARFGPEIMNFALTGLNLVPLLAIIYVSLKRLMNLGMSRWWIFGNLVPILNIWLGYRCFACPAGYAFHKKLDTPGIFLAIVWFFIVVVAIATVVTLVGNLGTPEVQQQLREILARLTAPLL